MRARDINKLVDERGFFAEVFRQDWRDFLDNDAILQANLSQSQPGIIRAWHRHSRGQVDYLVVVKGSVKICAYDDEHGSQSNGQLAEIVASEERLQVVRVPGKYWHGTKALGPTASLILYLINRAFDPAHPDEERRPWNDPKIIDPKTSSPFDWNRVPHK